LGDWPRYLGCGQCLQLNLTDWPVVFRIYHLGHEHYHKIQLTSYIVHDSLHSSLQLPPNLKSNKKTWKNNGSEWNNGKTRLRNWYRLSLLQDKRQFYQQLYNQ